MSNKNKNDGDEGGSKLVCGDCGYRFTSHKHMILSVMSCGEWISAKEISDRSDRKKLCPRSVGGYLKYLDEVEKKTRGAGKCNLYLKEE